MAKKISKHASMGGKARAIALTADRRSEIAREAVEARWERQGKLRSKVLRATHGDPDHPLRIGKLEIPCYVLEDGTRVLSGRGMQAAMNLGQGHGALLTSFLNSKNLKPFIDNDLAMVIKKPIRFVRPGRGGKLAVGFEATVLADVCDAVLMARSSEKLTKRELLIAKQCEILTRAFAKVGIIALIDEATGYQAERERDALARILEAFVSKDLKKWVKTFPPEYYRELCRLKGVEYPPQKKTFPQYFGHLTNNIIYDRLAPGVKNELQRRNPVIDRKHRRHKHHQHLTLDVGHPALREHLWATTVLMKASDDWEQFKRSLDKALPVQIDVPMPLWEDQDLPIE